MNTNSLHSDRMLRGGGIWSDAHDVRSAYRRYGGPNERVRNVGIRLVRTLQ